MMPARIRVDDVRAALRAEDVIARYGLRARKLGNKYRLAACPQCGAKSSSWAISINTRKGTWGHFGHGRNEGGACYGDLIDLVAACEGLGRKSQWKRVLEVCAEIAGVTAASCEDDRARRLEERTQRQRQQAAEEAQEARERRARAAADWRTLRRHHEAGERYIRERGLDPGRLVDLGHVLFDDAGNVCVRLHDLADGELVTVTRRLIVPMQHDPTRKVHTPIGGTTRGTLCGRVMDIEPDKDTIIAEGIFDTLTAIMLWPDAVVLGAAGAGQLTAIAKASAARVYRACERLTIVPDSDDVGVRCTAQAVIAAEAAGLVLDRDLVVLELGDHHDLNDAHRAGWKP